MSLRTTSTSVLPDVPRLERQVVEPEAHERLAGKQVEREVLQLGEHLDARLALAGRPTVDGEHQAALGHLQHRIARPYGQLAQLRTPLVAEAALDGARRKAVDELEHVVRPGRRHSTIAASTSARLRQPVADERRQLRGGGPHLDRWRRVIACNGFCKRGQRPAASVPSATEAMASSTS